MEKMKWEEAYKYWQHSGYYFPEILSAPITAETVMVNAQQAGYFYGYDWLRNDDAQNRKHMIADNLMTFLYFTTPSNKGTITTAQMLIEAEDEEERAAVWIAATAFELMQMEFPGGLLRFSWMLNDAACEFLRERYQFLWHYAMRKLVPKIMIPYTVLSNIKCDHAEIVMGLIQTNVMLIKSNYTPLCYSSVDESDPKFKEIVAENRQHK